MTWSSYPQHQLMVEGFRDFFKRKKKSSATYPASELTTIVNLISNLAKKLSIETDTGAIVDEFEAMLKSQNIDLQEQDDRLMIGADLNLTLDKATKLKQFMTDLKEKNPQALQLLVKALEKGAFNVPDEQQATPVTPEPAQSAPTAVEPEEEEEESEAAASSPPVKKSDDVSLSQIVKQDFTTGDPQRGVVKLGRALKSFINNRNVDDKLANQLVGKQVVKQLPPEMRNLITIDQLRDFIWKNFPTAKEEDMEALLQSVENRKVIAEHILHSIILEEIQRVVK